MCCYGNGRIDRRAESAGGPAFLFSSSAVCALGASVADFGL